MWVKNGVCPDISQILFQVPSRSAGENGVIHEGLRRWGRNFAPIYFSFTTGMLSRNPAA